MEKNLISPEDKIISKLKDLTSKGHLQGKNLCIYSGTQTVDGEWLEHEMTDGGNLKITGRDWLEKDVPKVYQWSKLAENPKSQHFIVWFQVNKSLEIEGIEIRSPIYTTLYPN